MKILITGNMGYVGPVVIKHLRTAHPGAEIIGFDSGFFSHCLTGAAVIPEINANVQLFGDIREFDATLLKGVDAVVQLAAVSNDPMGNRFEAVTDEINHRAGLHIAKLARDHGVKNYIFASSCSMYGAAEGGPRKETDQLNPLTAYARSKVATEQGLAELDRGGMTVTALRFATACGMSPRLRLDLVLNDFVACALSSGEITVLSDGTPWRPLIHVEDMARAIDWAITRSPQQGGGYLAVNTGSDRWNYQVRDFANAVATAIPGTRVSINTDAPPDKRSYSVDFSLYRSLVPEEYQPKVTLDEAIAGLRDGLTRMNFADAAFRNSHFMRLKVLEQHMAEGRLRDDLHWATI
jgi:nucleoside-diphosphate-sugar epimerase